MHFQDLSAVALTLALVANAIPMPDPDPAQGLSPRATDIRYEIIERRDIAHLFPLNFWARSGPKASRPAKRQEGGTGGGAAAPPATPPPAKGDAGAGAGGAAPDGKGKGTGAGTAAGAGNGTAPPAPPPAEGGAGGEAPAGKGKGKGTGADAGGAAGGAPPDGKGKGKGTGGAGGAEAPPPPPLPLVAERPLHLPRHLPLVPRLVPELQLPMVRGRARVVLPGLAVLLRPRLRHHQQIAPEPHPQLAKARERGPARGLRPAPLQEAKHLLERAKARAPVPLRVPDLSKAQVPLLVPGQSRNRDRWNAAALVSGVELHMSLLA
ncbi:hypothetical protein PG991_007753 [Apiospora marii]|uniref:Uncharacterized protein n=1 Tax=Apiospora marii TaxID=335849 RepID=A0ABR1RUE9_9PEZI